MRAQSSTSLTARTKSYSTRTPDYAHGAYLCQIRPVTETSEETEEPIRFLSGSFSGAQTRWSTIEREAFSIYWELKKLDDLLGGIAFTIRTEFALHEQPWLQEGATVETGHSALQRHNRTRPRNLQHTGGFFQQARG